jgi:rubrerythrin
MKMTLPAAPIEPFWMPMNQDKKIEELMEQAYKEEKQMQYYDHALMEQMSDEQDKKRIYQIYMDQRKHCKMFEEMYYRMTARKPEDHHKKPALTHDIKKIWINAYLWL